jgi:DNA-binding SARP family transcriptional activator
MAGDADCAVAGPLDADDAWAIYAVGAMSRYDEPRSARARLQQACERFAAEGDPLGQLRCLASIAETYYIEWDDLTALPDLAHRMLGLLEGIDTEVLDADTDLAVHARLALALLVAGHDLDRLRAVVTRLWQRLPACTHPAEKMLAAAVVYDFHIWHAPVVPREELVRDLGLSISDESIHPLLRVWWSFKAACLHLEGTRELMAQAKQLARQHRLTHTLRYLDHVEAESLLSVGNLDGARAVIDRMALRLKQYSRLDVVYYDILEAIWFMRFGDFETALQFALQAEHEGRQRGLPRMQQAHMEVIVANVYTGLGDFGKADEWHARAAHSAHGAPECEAQGDFARAYARLSVNDDDGAKDLLAHAFAGIRQRGSRSYLKYLPRIAATLAEAALAADIEPEVARAFAIKLPPPDANSPWWPWPLAARTLGGLQVSRLGVPISDKGRSGHRPLSMLALLLSTGPHGVDCERLAALMWQDGEVSWPLKALEITVHRLRKWLGSDEAVLLNGGIVSLNEAAVWTDIRALERIFDHTQRIDRSTALADLHRHQKQLISLYRGPYLPQLDHPLVDAAREQHRRRFLASVDRVGWQLEQRGERARALALYRHGTCVEPVGELLYRGLMRSAHATADLGAARSAYRRCAETMRKSLGIEPSVETRRLAQELGLTDDRSRPSCAPIGRRQDRSDRQQGP